MKPLFVLLSTYILSCLLFWLITHHAYFFLSGRIAIGIMLVSTSIAHFVFIKGMTLMIPEFIPGKKMIVYLTGIIEILAGICIMIPKTYHTTAILLVIFFLAILPSNITAAKQKIDLEKANYEGKGLSYLWFRIPLQILFIAWVWYFGIIN